MARPVDPRNRPYRIAIYILFLGLVAALASLTAIGVVQGVYFDTPAETVETVTPESTATP